MDYNENDILVNINDIKAVFFDKLLEHAKRNDTEADSIMRKLLNYQDAISVIEEKNNLLDK